MKGAVPPEVPMQLWNRLGNPPKAGNPRDITNRRERPLPGGVLPSEALHLLEVLVVVRRVREVRDEAPGGVQGARLGADRGRQAALCGLGGIGGLGAREGLYRRGRPQVQRGEVRVELRLGAAPPSGVDRREDAFHGALGLAGAQLLEGPPAAVLRGE